MPGSSQISVIVPALNEAAHLERCVGSVRACQDAGGAEVVVVDGGSTDATWDVADRCGATVLSAPRGRALQMNAGAAKARGSILLFLHADTILPTPALIGIRDSLADPGVVGGCFRIGFDVPHPVLRLYGAASRLPFRWLRFGDQGLFVRRSVFEVMQGYRPLPLMEDVDFFDRLGRQGRVEVLPDAVITSARRFLEHGVVRQQLRNGMLLSLYRLGVSPARLARFYRPTVADR